MAGRGESLREAREAIERALEHRRRRARRLRWRGKWAKVLLGAATLAAGVALLVSAGLVPYHWYGGAPFADGIKMTIKDYLVAWECPRNGEMLADFVGRVPLGDDDLELRARLGDSWAEKICAGQRIPSE